MMMMMMTPLIPNLPPLQKRKALICWSRGCPAGKKRGSNSSSLHCLLSVAMYASTLSIRCWAVPFPQSLVGTFSQQQLLQCAACKDFLYASWFRFLGFSFRLQFINVWHICMADVNDERISARKEFFLHFEAKIHTRSVPTHINQTLPGHFYLLKFYWCLSCRHPSNFFSVCLRAPPFSTRKKKSPVEFLASFCQTHFVKSTNLSLKTTEFNGNTETPSQKAVWKRTSLVTPLSFFGFLSLRKYQKNAILALL